MDSDQQAEMYKRWGVPAPSHEEHGTPEDIRAQLEKAVATSWHLEGNVLVAETQHGIIKQTIPPDYICLGMDKKNLPILKKIGTK